METLEADDIQKLNHSIQKLYTLHNLDTFGVDSLEIVNGLVPSNLPVFHLTNMQTYQIEDTFLPRFPSLSSELQRVKSLYLNEHPLVQNSLHTLNGAYKISDFVSQKVIEEM